MYKRDDFRSSDRARVQPVGIPINSSLICTMSARSGWLVDRVSIGFLQSKTSTANRRAESSSGENKTRIQRPRRRKPIAFNISCRLEVSRDLSRGLARFRRHGRVHRACACVVRGRGVHMAVRSGRRIRYEEGIRGELSFAKSGRVYWLAPVDTTRL